MPFRGPLFAVITALAVVASGLTAVGVAAAAPSITPGPNGYVPPPISWGKCEKELDFPKRYRCGTVEVPLDWNDVGGAKIQLAVSRVTHTAARYQGVMLTNPGGPGAPGRGLAGLGFAVPGRVGDQYDWIGVDPRGAGASRPAIACVDDYNAGPRPPYEPGVTAYNEHQWIARAKGFAAACAENNQPLIRFISTEASAKDMDAIRAALGQEQINYYGFSSGTYLGQVYATLFPTHLRRTVLDGNVGASRNGYQSVLDQDIAFEKVIQRFFAWIAKYDRVYHLGRTKAAVEKRFYAVQRRLDANPVGAVGGDEWLDTMLDAGYTRLDWPDLARAFSRFAVKGDRKALRTAYETFGDAGGNDILGSSSAVFCNESTWPSYDQYRVDSALLNEKAPFLTWSNAWFTAQCVFWKLPRVNPVQIDGSKAPAMLLINETLDAATPYEGALETRQRFPKSVLLAEPGGTSHAFSLFGNTCVDGTVAKYLRDGTLPTRKPGDGADKLCAPLPVPTP